MWDSLLKLRALPDDFKLYCGHEYTASNVNSRSPSSRTMPH